MTLRRSESLDHLHRGPQYGKTFLRSSRGFPLLTNGSYPVIDESSGGSLAGMIAAVEELLRLANAETVVVPGHGAIGNRAALLCFHNMLSTIEGRIKPLIASHSTAAEILAATPTADFDLVWGQGYVTGDIFVRMVLAGFGLRETAKALS